MTISTTFINNTSVPYFAQWESSDLVSSFLQTPESAATDPLWPQSGARSAEEYAQWSRHLCGIACLKMILATFRQQTYPSFELMRLALKAGAYIETQDDIKGLIYAPFLRMIKDTFQIEGEIFSDVEAHELPDILSHANYLMVSVHPSIRSPHQIPPSRGGHLVLITQANIDTGVVFHNPSGDTPGSQANATVSLDTFRRFFAGRGMAIRTPLS